MNKRSFFARFTGAFALLLAGLLLTTFAGCSSLIQAPAGSGNDDSALQPGSATEPGPAAKQSDESAEERMLLGEVSPEGYSLSIEIQDDTHAVVRLTDPLVEPQYSGKTLGPEIKAADGTRTGHAYLMVPSWTVFYDIDKSYQFNAYPMTASTDSYESITPLQMHSWFDRGIDDTAVWEGTTLVWTLAVAEEQLKYEPDFSFYDYDQFDVMINRDGTGWMGTFYAP